MNRYKPPFSYLVIDDPLMRDVFGIKEYQSKLKKYRYSPKLPKGDLLKFCTHIKNIEKWVKKFKVYFPEIFPSNYFKKYEKELSHFGEYHSNDDKIDALIEGFKANGYNFNRLYQNEPVYNPDKRNPNDPNPFFLGPKVAQGAMTGRPSEWFTETIEDKIKKDEKKAKMRLVGISPRHGKHNQIYGKPVCITINVDDPRKSIEECIKQIIIDEQCHNYNLSFFRGREE